jgi:pyridoxal phosphate enzyme (YggS family)
MIKENVLRIKERIILACLKVNRDPDAITIVAVSKGRATTAIEQAQAAGIADIGENRVQEALSKYKVVYGERTPLKWHMVGHLQTNKVKEAVRIFDLIHSVDSIHLAQEIDKQAAKISKIQDVLIEVKTSPEATKFGIEPDKLSRAVAQMSRLKNIDIKGLMTIAPLVDNPEKARLYFRILKELLERINRQPATGNRQPILSMGMSDDFEVAVEEGATMLRIGRAIFE